MKAEKSSIKKNILYQTIYEILMIILPFVTSPYIARVIGAEGLGIYSYSHSVAYYFVLFSMMGIKNYGNRAVAQSRDDDSKLNRTFSNILFLHIAISVICLMAYVGYILWLKEERIYAIIQGAYVLSALFDISWFYFGIEKFKFTVTRNSIIKIINVILVFALVRKAEDLWIYCVIMAVGTLVSQLVLWVPLKKYVKIERPQWEHMKVHVKPMLILFIPAIAVSLYKYMDKIMIGGMSSRTQLGYYENAEKINSVPITIIGAFGTVMLPKMSNLVSKNDRTATNKYISTSMQFIMCLSLALAFGLAGVGEIFAPIFWGKSFATSGTIIKWLSVTVPFITFANIIRTQYLIPTHKDKEYMFSVVAGAIVNLAINALLIPQYGAMGATVGTIAAEIAVCLIQAFAVRRELPIKAYAGVYAIGLRLGVRAYTLAVQVIFGGVVYGTLVFIYFVKTKNETFINAANKILGKFNIKLNK